MTREEFLSTLKAEAGGGWGITTSEWETFPLSAELVFLGAQEDLDSSDDTRRIILGDDVIEYIEDDYSRYTLRVNGKTYGIGRAYEIKEDVAVNAILDAIFPACVDTLNKKVAEKREQERLGLTKHSITSFPDEVNSPSALGECFNEWLNQDHTGVPYDGELYIGEFLVCLGFTCVIEEVADYQYTEVFTHPCGLVFHFFNDDGRATLQEEGKEIQHYEDVVMEKVFYAIVNKA